MSNDTVIGLWRTLPPEPQPRRVRRAGSGQVRSGRCWAGGQGRLSCRASLPGPAVVAPVCVGRLPPRRRCDEATINRRVTCLQARRPRRIAPLPPPARRACRRRATQIQSDRAAPFVSGATIREMGRVPTWRAWRRPPTAAPAKCPYCVHPQNRPQYSDNLRLAHTGSPKYEQSL